MATARSTPAASSPRVTEPMHDFEKLFRPRSVAVIGASGDPEKLGGRTLLHIKELGFKGRIFPINVSGKDVQGLPSWKSVAELPEVPDSAIIVLPASAVPAALEDCAARGVRHVQILSSGFAEEGGEGIALQDRVTAIARAHRIRFTGPNALGSISPADGFYGTFSSLLATAVPRAGSIGVATQSGAFGSHIYAVAGFRGLGISRAIATGNEADIDVAAAIEYLTDDPGTTVICASLEGCRDGEALRVALLRAAAIRKPVVIMKVGSTEVGAAAAATHTGSLAIEDRLVDAVLRECGAFRVSSIEEMLDVAYVLATGPRPGNDRIGVLTVSGGIGVLMADAAIGAGMSVPALPGDALARIRSVLPLATGRNPLDSTANVGGRLHLFGQIAAEMIGGADLGACFLYLAHLGRNLERFPPLEEGFAALRRDHPDVTVVAVMTHVEEIRKRLESLGVPVFEDPNRAVRAVAGAAALRRLQAEATPRPTVPPATTPLPPIGNEAAAKALLRDAGLPVPSEHPCRTAEEAVRAAAAIGSPVVLKVLSDDIPHKTEVGGVMLGVEGAEAVAKGFGDLLRRVQAARPAARLDGVLVAPMLAGGIETILGVQDDPVFGPMVMFGLGGVSVELLGDVAFASAPLSEVAAERLIGQVRAARLLDGFRGSPPLDRGALVRALCQLSALAVARRDQIASIEINPLLVRPHGAAVLDALVVPRR
ncbi:acetate--CoA ligase family protein [Muricoccus radiodurans]|uniref:acetate--CoA ligase family protein n=1 Tax=Muricoccus radiodurans TaxID=2231721 RepID=UPI003CF32DC0